MASALTWKSFQLSNKFYQLMYPHVLSFDVKNQRLLYEPNKSRLIPFYFLNIVLCIHLFSSMYLLRCYFQNPHIFANYLAIFFVSMSGFIAVVLAEHAIMMIYGKELCANQYHICSVTNSLKTNLELKLNSWNMNKPCILLLFKGMSL